MIEAWRSLKLYNKITLQLQLECKLPKVGTCLFIWYKSAYTVAAPRELKNNNGITVIYNGDVDDNNIDGNMI